MSHANPIPDHPAPWFAYAVPLLPLAVGLVAWVFGIGGVR